ncbi:MAG: TraR/DksA family transcriptional regulator [bacterium]
MDRSDLDLDALKQALLDERAALLAADDATADDRAPVALDQQSVGRLSRMDALQLQAMAKAQCQRRAQRLKLIDAALSRIKNGEYGICTECDEDIPAKRLEVDPAFARCVDCAGK